VTKALAGACTIIMDGKECSLLWLSAARGEAERRDLLTIGGLPKDDPVIEPFAESV